MADFKIEDLLNLGKLNSTIAEKKKDEDCKRAIRIVLICVGALTVIAGIAYLVYRLVNRYEDYDLYDDLDSFYEEDEEEPANENEASEKDFAE